MRIVFIIAVTILSNLADAEVTAPFGLTWGQTQSEIRAMNIQLDCDPPSSRFTTCSATTMPSSVSFAEFYGLMFDRDEGLQKAILVGSDITNDVSGAKGKENFNSIRDVLANKYGEWEGIETIGNDLYDEYDEFYQCLNYDGCGMWASYWQADAGGFVFLELVGQSRGTGYLKLTYESPSWSNLVDRASSETSSNDAGAL